jgi:nucleoside-diphosphate kinase
MTGNITFTIIKPGAVSHEHIGDILKMISEAGFGIAAMKYTKLSQSQAAYFYNVHKGKPFFDGLVEFMTSGPIVVAILEKENAVQDYRKLIGNTDPAKAEPGTIRKLFAESVQRNAVHGSDSDANARKEADFFFSKSERFDRAGNFLELVPVDGVDCQC